MKNIFFKFFILLLLFVSPKVVFASEGIVARIGNNYYDLLSDAIEAAGPNDVITLASSMTLDETQPINKTITIDLNDHNILGESPVFNVEGGTLTIKGKGTVKEVNPYYAPVLVKGSTNKDDGNYSNVYIGEDVFLEGWSGVFIDHNDNTSSSYGVNITIDGDINSVLDTDGGAGFGVYINGNISNKENYPVVTINDTSEITSLGSGIYMAGYSKVIIDGAYLEGVESALAIKSGELVMNSGTLYCKGADKTPTEGYENGVNPSGAALQIESNKGYPGDIKITINGGSLRSKNSNVVYEYLKGTDTTKVSSINITGGTFRSDAKKDIFLTSTSFKNTHPSFISGGKYTSDVNTYLKSGYDITKVDDLYEVSKTTMNETAVFKEENKNGGIVLTIILTLGTVLTAGFIFVKKYFVI